MKLIELILKDITDQLVRENFSRLIAYFKGDNLRKADFKFFEITFQVGGTGVKYAHRLGYIPKDIIVTSVSDSEAVVFNYESFDRTNFDMDITAACTVRFFAGTYREQ